MYKVEKDILMPERTRYPAFTDFLKTLEAGDSFVVESRKELNRIKMCAYRNEINISCRKLWKDKEHWRIWRKT